MVSILFNLHRTVPDGPELKTGRLYSTKNSPANPGENGVKTDAKSLWRAEVLCFPSGVMGVKKGLAAEKGGSGEGALPCLTVRFLPLPVFCPACAKAGAGNLLGFRTK